MCLKFSLLRTCSTCDGDFLIIRPTPAVLYGGVKKPPIACFVLCRSLKSLALLLRPRPQLRSLLSSNCRCTEQSSLARAHVS